MVSLRKFSAIQGCTFESKPIAELCELLKTKRVTNHTIQCNRECKRLNVTLISMIGTLPTEAKINWQEQIPTLVHAYNCSHSNATGFSPFYLMFGRHPMCVPIDVQFIIRTPDMVASTSHGYIQKLQKRLDCVYKTAYKVSKKETECSKNWYVQNVKCTKLEPEDLG